MKSVFLYFRLSFAGSSKSHWTERETKPKNLQGVGEDNWAQEIKAAKTKLTTWSQSRVCPLLDL